MKKIMYLFLALVFLSLVSCTKTNESDVATAQKIKELVPEDKVIETLMQSNTSEEKTKFEDPFLNATVHECALFSREDGQKYCGFPRQGSEKTEFSCQQAFSSAGKPPYDQVGIKILTYGSSNEAKQKFVTDTFTLQGDKVKPYLSISQTAHNQRIAEFYKGKKVVRIIEVPRSSCSGFDELVKMAYVRAWVVINGLCVRYVFSSIC